MIVTNISVEAFDYNEPTTNVFFLCLDRYRSAYLHSYSEADSITTATIAHAYIGYPSIILLIGSLCLTKQYKFFIYFLIFCIKFFAFGFALQLIY